jgi:hypothetical protein
MTFLTLGMLFLGAVLFYINRKILVNLLKNTNRNTLIILILLILCFVLIIGFNFRSFSPSDQEWEELNNAKNLLSEDKNVFNHQRYGLIYPLSLFISFKIFGFTQYAASYLNFILAASSMFLVFVLSKVIFKIDSIAIFSTVIYILTPLILLYTALKMGFPTIIGFFLLLVILASILSFRYHRLSLYILALLLIALASQVKPEYFILVFPFVLCFLIFKEYKFLSLKKIIILILLFLLFSVPFFVKNAQFKEESASEWCGYPSQTFYDGKRWSYDLPIMSHLDKILRPLTNNRFSMNYLIYDLPNFIKFWSSEHFFFVLPFLLLGIFVALKGRYKKETIFILFTFFFISFVYLADCAFYEERYAMATYGPMVIFSGLGINFLQTKLFRRKKGNSFLVILLPIILLLVLTISFISHFIEYSRQYKSFPNYSEYNELKEISKGISSENSFIFVAHRNEEMILRFLGYKVYSLSNMLDVPYFENPEEFLKILKLPVEPGRKNYFIKTWYCQILIPLRDMCDFTIDNYVEREIDQKNSSTIYLLKDIN